jgi:P-type Ca2+ transporter type 2C
MSLTHWISSSIDEIVSDLNSDKLKGLSEAEAEKRLQQYGPNKITEEKFKTPWEILIAQFKSLLIVILIFAALSSFAFGDWIEALAIIFVVILNAILGFVQEYRADQSVKALKKMLTQTTRVFREGSLKEIAYAALVPGDIISIECGDKIPADVRLFDTVSFQVDESMLTGEAVSILKRSDPLKLEQAALGDMHNLGFMGTIVLNGRATALVLRTGLSTELGKIAALTQQVKQEKTPLEEKMEIFSKRLSLLLGLLCGVIFVMYFLRSGFNISSLRASFIFAISLAVAAIPESLPAVTTIVLSTGVHRMSKKNAVTRKLSSVETLGSTTVICTDKTGTITENKMRATAMITLDQEWYDSQEYPEFSPAAQWLRKVFYFNNDSRIEADRRMGDPTELALLDFAWDLDQSYHDIRFKRLHEIPFDSLRKRMLTVHQIDETVFVAVKGAYENIANHCSSIYMGDKMFPFTQELRSTLDKKVKELAQKGFRLLAATLKITPNKDEWTEENLCMLGLLAMRDPIRVEVPVAIDKCRLAGIRVIMLTGDHVDTAGAYAKELKMIPENGKVYNHFEMEAMNDERLKEILKTDAVFARITPEDKYRVVSLLKESGEIVAMTGDGVNDAPALRKADIGVAMGIRGTDLAREVSDLVLLDDNFATIVNAIEEGRKIYDNIKKTIFFLLSCNFGEILLVLGALLFSLPMPLSPLHLLWLNLITDSFPALALGLERAERNVMKPRQKKQSDIMNPSFFGGILFQAFFIGLGALYIFVRHLPHGLPEAVTVCFAGLVAIELLRALSARSFNDLLVRIGVFSNLSMIGAQILSFFFLLLAMYGPIGRLLFESVPLNAFQWIEVLLVAVFVLLMSELRKLVWKIN